MRMNLCGAVALLGIVMLAGSVNADVLLGNLPGTSSGTGTNLGIGIDEVDRTKAVGFTVAGDDWQFQAIDVLLSNDSDDTTLSGGIYADDGLGNPGTLLAAFDPVLVPSGTESAIFSTDVGGSFTFDAGTTYWVVLDGPAETNSLLWDSLDPNTAPTAAAGITFDGYRFSADGGTSWGESSIYNGINIRGVIPAPGALALLGLAGLASRRRRRH